MQVRPSVGEGLREQDQATTFPFWEATIGAFQKGNAVAWSCGTPRKPALPLLFFQFEKSSLIKKRGHSLVERRRDQREREPGYGNDF